MDCPTCGYDRVPEEARFCPNCSAVISKVPKSSAQITVVQDIDRVEGGAVTGVEISRVEGEVTIETINNNIGTLVQRALTAAEEAEKAWEIEAKRLAQGVHAFVQGLQTRTREASHVADGNPYKGLLAYHLSDAELFFGRDEAIRRFLDNLRRDRLTVLHAESGAGKTSLLQAGISPQLFANGYLPVHLRPYNTNPALTVKQAFLPNLGDAPGLAQAPLREFLRQVSGVLGPETAIFILLDQFEEFFTQLEESERPGFVRELAECREDASLNVGWVLAMRTEFFGRLASFRPRLDPFTNDYYLYRLTRSEAREVVVKPVAQRGVRFEDGLVDDFLDELSEEGQVAPPQVQLVCSALYEELKPSEEIITRALYDEMGGAKEILRRHLSRVLRRRLPEQQQEARYLLQALITSDRRRARCTHAELVAQLAPQGVSPEALDTILGELVESRLLQAPGGQVNGKEGPYELVHDYLLDEIELDPATQARKAAQEMLNREVAAYKSDKALRIPPDRLAIIEDQKIHLYADNEARALIDLSRQARRRDKMQRAMPWVALGLLVIVALVVIATVERRGRRIAEQQANIALSRQLAVQALSYLDQQQLDLSLLLGVQASRITDTLQIRSVLLAGLESNPHLVTFLHGYHHGMRSLAFSPDGKTLAAGGCRELLNPPFWERCSQGEVLLWDVTSGQPRGESLFGHYDWVTSVAFSPDNQTLASASGDSTIILWDMASGQPLGNPLRGQSAGVASIAFRPDTPNDLEAPGDAGGQVLASGGYDGTIILWNVASRQPIGDPFVGHEQSVTSVAFSPDGRTLASSSTDGKIILWDVAAGEPRGEPSNGHEHAVNSVVFSPDGQILASASDDKTIILWDVATGEPRDKPLTYHGSAVESLAFSSDGQILASGDYDGDIMLWDVATGEPRGESFASPDSAVYGLAFRPHTSEDTGSQILASASCEEARLSRRGCDKGKIRLWDIASPQSLGRPIPGYRRSVKKVAFSPDSQTLASIPWSAGDRDIILWDVATGQQRVEPLLGQRSVSSVAFSPDGQILAVGGSGDWSPIFEASLGEIRFWDAATGRPLGAPIISDHGGVNSIDFSPDGQTLASGSYDGTIILWDVASRQPLYEQSTGHEDLGVTSLAFSPDGQILALGLASGKSIDARIILWDVATGEPLGVPLTGHQLMVEDLAFSPNGQILASGSDDGTVILWDVVSGEPRGTLLTGFNEYVNGVAFSPDGRILASGSKTLILWDVATGQRLGTFLPDERDSVNSVAFSPDGQLLATAVEGGDAIILWDIGLDLWQERACRRANRNLSLDEWSQLVGSEVPYQVTCPGLPGPPETIEARGD